MALAEVLFLRVAAINAKANGRGPWAWRVFLTGIAIWTPMVMVLNL